MGHLMCRACWSEVPLELQRAVTRTWRKYSAFVGLEQSDERRAARLAYQAARDAALASIR